MLHSLHIYIRTKFPPSFFPFFLSSFPCSLVFFLSFSLPLFYFPTSQTPRSRPLSDFPPQFPYSSLTIIFQFVSNSETNPLSRSTLSCLQPPPKPSLYPNSIFAYCSFGCPRRLTLIPPTRSSTPWNANSHSPPWDPLLLLPPIIIVSRLTLAHLLTNNPRPSSLSPLWVFNFFRFLLFVFARFYYYGSFNWLCIDLLNVDFNQLLSFEFIQDSP